MAPPNQQTQETSTFETLSPIDSAASESAKLIKIARGYKNRSNDSAKIVNVNIYGYINPEAQNSSVTERNERAAMQQRMNNVRDNLVRMGVPDDKIWKGGVAFSSNRSGQIDVSIREVNLNSIILPPYTPSVPPTDPQKSPAGKEQWLDADGSVKKDVLKGELALEIELTFKEGGIFKTKPPISMKASVKQDGTVEFGAELTALEQDIKKKAFWGIVQDVKFKISAEASVGFKIDGKKLNSEINAAFKSALSAVFVIPGTSIKVPVEASIGVGINGEIVPGLQTTYRW